MPNGANKKLNFIPKVWDSKHENEDGSNGAYVPIYIAPDATNSVQGDVFLSDSVNGTQDAENGMTAATPKAVAQVASSAKSYTDTVAAGKANTAHTHEMADVTGLSDAVKDAKKAGTDAQAAASAALTDAKAYTDSVEVGGRNLLKGSMSVATAPRTHGWYSDNGGSPTVELVTLDGKECIHFSGTASGTAIPSIRTRSRVLLEWDSVYVMTCDMMFDKEILITPRAPQHYQSGSVENTDEFNLSVQGKAGGAPCVSYSPKEHEVIAANTWTRYTRVFKTNKTAPSDDYPYPTIAPFIYGDVRTVSETTEVNGWMRNFKIEKGTKATDWTPAPEDTDFAVADAQGTADDAWSRTLRVQVSSAPADAAGDTSALTATVWRGGQQLTEQDVAMMGLVAWYVGGKRVATGYTYTCAAGTAVECRLEA